MKWYIIRHADKEQGDFYNSDLRHQDQPISEKGHLKAQKLFSYFSDKSIDKIYVSEYIRTKQTIKYVAEKKKISPIADSRLNEIDNGLIEGLSEQVLQQRYPDVWNAFKDRDRDFQFPEGESGEDARRRIKSFFKDKLLSKEDLILVSHDGLIRLLLCYILGIAVYRRWDFRVDTCGIMEIEYQTTFKKWKLIRFNHICT
ncbi:MAG: histidine phosphatase family protein [Candidatus Lokiarchaeota archaeon]|nr:histidine phosphatase family protein [Candidatus Lokiarchaeota archaeon]